MSGQFESWDNSDAATDVEKDVVVLADEKQKQLKVYCQLCGQVYRDPYITSCGHTFCCKCVSGTPNALCPVDSTKLTLLVKNLAVAEEVEELLVHCCYGCKPHPSGGYEVDPDGCPVKVKLGMKLDHERECDYALVKCPNSSFCGTMLRKDLSAHLKGCQFIPCPHFKFNCSFQGTVEALEEHLKTCKFEGVKGFLNQMDSQMESLQQELEKKDVLIQQLNSSINTLTTKLEMMEKTSSDQVHRIEWLEEQHSEMRKEMTQTKKNISITLGEVKMVQQQLFQAGVEQQHLFLCQGTFVGHKGPVWALAKRNEMIFSASADNTIKVWNLSATYAGPKTLTGHDGIILALFVHNDHLFSGSSDTTIKVWAIDSLSVQSSFKAHDDPVCTLAGNDTYLCSGSLKSIKVWDMQTHGLVKVLPSQNHWVRTLVIAGRHLYSGSYQAVKIWDLDSLEVSHVLKCKGASVYSLVVTDQHIVCGTYENTIQVWDVRTLQDMGRLTGHVGTVYALAILKTPGKVRLFSGSYDKTIRVWNLELMMCAQTLVRHEGSVTCLITVGGKLFSGAVDSSIKMWQ